MTDAQRRANKKWNDAHRGEKYEQIGLLVFKGEKAEFQAAATAAGERSLSAYIRQAVREKMSRDAAVGGGASLFPANPNASFMSIP